MKATVKTWTPTKYPRLYRHSSGTYYARISTAGKETWRSLKTKVLSVAKIEHEKEQASAEQRAELGTENLLSEKLTGAAAIAIRQRQFQNNPAIKQSTKHYLEQIVLMVKRTWPELEESALRRITVEQCEEWAGRVAKQMSSPRFNASLSMVRSLFEIAVERGVRRTNPAATKLAPSAVVIIGYGIAFYFLSLVLKSIPVGVAYAVWSGLGVVIITAIAWLLHGQKLDAWGFVGMGLIIAAFLLARSPSWKSLRRPTPW